MPSARVPNLWHLFLFLGLALVSLIPAELLAILPASLRGGSFQTWVAAPLSQTLAGLFTYLIALAFAFLLLPFVWHRPFLQALSWRAAAARWPLALLGLAIGFAGQAVTVFLPMPRDLPMQHLFQNPATIWLMALFAIVMGPLFEEVLFRGFVLPAFANAIDWLRIPRDPDPSVALATLDAWRQSTAFSRPAIILSTLFTSLFFVSIHGPQLAWTWSALSLLFFVSLVLCAVRLRTRSVAASTLVHACYNLSIFITIFVGTGGFRHLDRM